MTTDFTATLTAVLDEYFDQHTHRAQAISPHYATLWGEVARLARSGGKKMRPKMTLMSYQAFGGRDVEKILPIAAAQELLHVGLLIHDDIIDRDTLRYGVDTIDVGYQKIYQSLVGDVGERTHYAQSAALLAGDLLLTGAQQLILESDIEPARIIEVQRIFGTGIFEVIGGELIDVESTFREAGTISPETVARYKTASYSFMSPLLIGAVLAGASKEDQVLIREFAEAVGVAFQLRDDLIGDESVTGKSATGDIREGKRTYIVEQFYKLANDEQKGQFEQYFGKHNITSEGVETVRKLMSDSGARQKTEEAILKLETQASQALDSLSDSVQTQPFKELITLATRRNK